MRTIQLMWELWFKPLLCKHDYYLVRCIYGDEAMQRNSRYEYRCEKCGKVKYTWKVVRRHKE